LWVQRALTGAPATETGLALIVILG